jgi:F-type H+-transporting ATPase subunit a
MAMDPAEAASHVKDATSFHLPFGVHIDLPCLGMVDIPGWSFLGLFDVPPIHWEMQLTKFMVLEAVAAILMILVFVPLARRIRTGEPVRGRFGNFFEMILMFLRDQVARPVIGRHDADRFLPYVWTIFFFILFCNLLGMIPWCGSPTGAWACTLVLAVASLVIVFGTGMRKYGPIGYFRSLMPHMDLPFAMKIIIIPLMGPMIVAIEVLGVIIKHFVLSVRLLANMFAGHLVLATIIGFLGATAGTSIWYGVLPASLLGAVALSMLELFVAFLQAYIFAFLSALFIGMALHPH